MTISTTPSAAPPGRTSPDPSYFVRYWSVRANFAGT